MRWIKGKILFKGKKWFGIVLEGYNEKNPDYLLIDDFTKKYKVGDIVNLYVKSVRKENDGKVKWFHIPTKKYAKEIVIGFGVDNHIIQPCIGNVFVKGDRAYKVKNVTKRSDGWSYGYTSEYWWECICEDITRTQKGQKAIEEQIDKLEI